MCRHVDDDGVCVCVRPRPQEVRRLLTSATSVTVRLPNNPEVADPEMMGQMQAHLWVLAARTTSLPLGRGALTLATSHLLLTEPVPVPRLNLSGRVPQQNNATISLDMGQDRAGEVRPAPPRANRAFLPAPPHADRAPLERLRGASTGAPGLVGPSSTLCRCASMGRCDWLPGSR